MKYKLQLTALFLAAALLCGLLTGCAGSEKGGDLPAGYDAIDPQIVFSRNDVTVTADGYRFLNDTLYLHARADNESERAIGSMRGCAYMGELGVLASLSTSGGLPAGEKDMECMLIVYLDRLRFLDLRPEMIGGELSVILEATPDDESEPFLDTRTVTLPAAAEALPDPGEGVPVFACRGEAGDYGIAYLGERKAEDGALELTFRFDNRTGEPWTPLFDILSVNGVELDKTHMLGMNLLGPDSSGVDILSLSPENCVACGIDSFEDIETLGYVSLTMGLHRFYQPGLLLEYRAADAHPAGESVSTARGDISVHAELSGDGDQVDLEVRIDMGSISGQETLDSLISDIEQMTFVNGCGEKFTQARITTTVDGSDICCSGTLDVRHVDEALSLCFLVIGDEVWSLES